MKTWERRRLLDDCRRLLDDLERSPERRPEHPPRPYVSPRAHRRLRRLTVALAILVAVPVAVILTIVFGLNPIARSVVEKLGSSAMKVPVVLDRAQINPLGAVRLHRLAIGNPLPFKEVRAFRTDMIAAEIALASAFKDVIEVNELVILHPRMIVEAGREKLNWGVLMDHLQKPSGKRPVGEVKRKEKKFIIHRIRIVRPVVVIRSPKVSQGGTEIVLRDIQLEGVGSAPGSAATLPLVLATVFQALLTGALDEWGDIPGSLHLGDITSSTSKSNGNGLKKAEN
jgi:uncharacterized protein involved in outer membrane biogenesis